MNILKRLFIYAAGIGCSLALAVTYHSAYSIQPEKCSILPKPQDGDYAEYPVWSPDNQRIAFIFAPKDQNRQIYTIHAKTLNTQQITTFNNGLIFGNSVPGVVNSPIYDAAYFPQNLVWTPDSQKIIFRVFIQRFKESGPSFDDQFILVDANSFESRILIDRSGKLPVNGHGLVREDAAFAVSPDTKTIVYEDFYDKLFYNPIDSETIIPSLDNPYIAASVEKGNLAWSSDGKYLAVISADIIFIIKMPEAVTVRSLAIHAQREIAWSPDNTRIAFLKDNGIFVVNADDSRLVQITTFDQKSGQRQDYNIHWLPDGKHIAFESQRGDNFGLYIIDPDTLRETQIVSGNSPMPQYLWSAWSNDGKRVAFIYKNSMQVADITTPCVVSE